MKAEDDEIDLGALAKSSEAAPVVKLRTCSSIDALKRGASDIHIEPYEKEFRVRFRIDGILYNVMALPMKLRDPLHLAHQDHGQAGHLGEAAAPGRPHQDPAEGRGPEPRDGLPRLLLPDALGREDRAAAARQDEAHARHDQAGLRGRLPRALQARDRQALRHRARHRAHGLGQDQHALLRASPSSTSPTPTS